MCRVYFLDYHVHPQRESDGHCTFKTMCGRREEVLKPTNLRLGKSVHEVRVVAPRVAHTDSDELARDSVLVQVLEPLLDRSRAS